MSAGRNSIPIGDRMKMALSMPGLSYGEKATLALIAYCDGPGLSWPSYQWIADTLGIHRGRVVKFVQQLQAKGVITVKRGQHTNIFTIDYNKADCPEKRDTEESGVTVPKNDSFSVPKNGTRTGIEQESINPPYPPLRKGGRVRREKKGTLAVTMQAIASLRGRRKQATLDVTAQAVKELLTDKER